jgi:formate dehydrogenase maturation protein FdhE
MHDRAGSESRWDTRVARARMLAASRPAAAEALAFYAEVAAYQKSLLHGCEPITPSTPHPVADALDLEPVLGAIPGFLDWLPRVAPVRLAEAVADLRRLERDQWRHFVHAYRSDWRHFVHTDWGQTGVTHLSHPSLTPGDDHALTFVLEAVLQPFVEQAAIAEAGMRRRPQPDASGQACCPFCKALPVVGVLREEGHGAKRTLVCALCLMEREYLRVVCPSCGEQQFDALPVYTADELEYVRIEACDHCHHYLKTIDLTKDGLAVPLVDDIASVSLDLWARDRGYVRLRANLLGL